MKLPALVALVLALGVTSTAGATSGSRHRGVLYGVVTHGPACTGQPGPCGEPMPGVKIVFRRVGYRAVETETGTDGRYRIRLLVGRYRIELPGRTQWKPTEARILRAKATRVNIAIDSLTG